MGGDKIEHANVWLERSRKFVLPPRVLKSVTSTVLRLWPWANLTL